MLPGEAIIGRLLPEAFARPDDAVGYRKLPVDLDLPLRDLGLDALPNLTVAFS